LFAQVLRTFVLKNTFFPFKLSWFNVLGVLIATRSRKLSLVLALIALGSLGFSGYLGKEFLTYQVNNPPVTPFISDRCYNQGLVAHWKLDEITHGTTPDASSEGNVGVIGIPLGPLARYRFKSPPVVPGRLDNAFELQTRQWVLAENSGCFSTDVVSVMAWVWMESTAYVPTIAAKSSWPSDGWWLSTTTAPPFSQNRFLDLGIAWGSGMTHVQSGYQMPLREWHHVAVTMDNTRHEVQFFIDGKLYGRKHTGVHPWTVNYKSPFTIGDYDGTGRWPWHGKIDDVRVYNRVATDKEIAATFAAASQQPRIP
jgi:hypothetical protein